MEALQLNLLPFQKVYSQKLKGACVTGKIWGQKLTTVIGHEDNLNKIEEVGYNS